MALEFRGNTTASAVAPTTATRPREAGDLLDARMAEVADQASTIVAGSSTTVLRITDTHRSRFGGAADTNVGTMVLVEGGVAMITTKADGAVGGDDLTVTPALPVIPTLGAVVFGGVNWTPITTGYLSHWIEMYLGPVTRIVLPGWSHSIRLEGMVANEIPRWVFSGPCDSHLTGDVTRPWTPTFDLTLPRAARTMRVVLDGVAIIAKAVPLIDLGLDVKPHTSVTGAHGKDGHTVVGRMSMGTIKIDMEDGADEIERFEGGQVMSLLVQHGDTAPGCVAAFMPRIQYTGAPIALEEGTYVHEIPFRILASTTTGVEDLTVTAF